MIKEKDLIPVFMFHSLNVHDRVWPFSHLSIPLSMVEQLLIYILKNRYQTIFLDEWYEQNGYCSDQKNIAITFDDGYLDNWVYLYPLLEKYECKATIFINPDFVQPEGERRPNLCDVWRNNIEFSELHDLGFMNWQEIKYMDKSGLVDIQSHSMTHTWYFTGERIIEFHKPLTRGFPLDPQYPWLSWNEFSEYKPYYLNEDQSRLIPFGTPIYENGRSLGIRRYNPNKEIAHKICEYVREKGRAACYQPDFNKELFRFYLKLAQCYDTKGYFESEEDQISRFRFELKQSKDILKNKLNKSVNYLCWPGGAYTNLSLSLSEQVGYLASTISSQGWEGKINNRGSYKRIKRIPMSGNIAYRGRRLGVSINKKKLLHKLNGSKYINLQLQIEKLFRLALSKCNFSLK